MPLLLIALASGLIGAKVWYAVLHPGPWRQAIKGGWAVDGFLVAALLVAVVVAVASNLPLGTFFDDATPGLFVGVAIGVSDASSRAVARADAPVLVGASGRRTDESVLVASPRSSWNPPRAWSLPGPPPCWC